MAQQGVFAPVYTVNEAVFRSRWAGPQVDETGAVALTPAGEGVRAVTDAATKLRQGLYLGGLRFRPGLSLGWDYTDRNYEGQVTTSPQNNQSYYIAPSIGLEYARETGPWAGNFGFGGSYTYYLNPDYNAYGSGSSRDPFNSTLSLGLGHSGTRHSAGVAVAGSYGNGENVQANGFTTNFNGGATLSYDYLVNDFLTAGAYASYKSQLTRYSEDNQSDSDLTSLRAGAYLDWLFTGKTTVGLKIDAGRLSSTIVQNAVVAAPTPTPDPLAVAGASSPPTPAVLTTNQQSVTQSRQFAELLLVGAHNLTAKILVTGGVGASYTVDEGITNANSQYTGVRPAYLLGLKVDPSEKTSARAFTSFQGADLVPSYGVSFTWRPRLNTSLNLSVYQNQNFSISAVGQYQINRGFVIDVQQVLFSKVTIGLSGGWQQTRNVSLSSDSTFILPDNDYAFVAANLSWGINSWASWVASVRASTGYQNGSSNSTTSSGFLDFPETTASVGLNLLF